MARSEPDLSPADVVVVGSVNVDLVFRVPHLPAAGETVIGATFSRGPGGKGANLAAAAAKLGGRVRFIGTVGVDDLAWEARADLEGAGVDASQVGSRPVHTGVAGIFVDRGGENAIAVASGANAELEPGFVREALAGIDVPHAVVAANLEIPDEAVATAAEVAAGRGWPFILNPAPARAVERSVLERCLVVAANEGEATALGSVAALLAAGAGAVVVTRGPEGADLHRSGRSVHRQPSFPVDVVDTTGAGDAFCGALAWAVADGRDLEGAVRLAAAAGALACREVGARAGLPDRAEVERLAAPV